MDDYAGTLRAYAALQPRQILLTLLPAGLISTFASAQQNLPGSVLAHWFFNIADIEAIMREQGYALTASWRAEEEFDFSNFPDGRRIAGMRNCLFSKQP